MTYPELVETIHVLKDSKLPTIRFETVKDGLVAFPVASFLMVLLAIPFGIREGRQVGIAKGFGLSLMFSLSYWVIYSLGISLGRGGVISPWLGAWFANIIVFSVAFVLYLMINRT
jgi:lipopolysaccharide export system permease protein